MIKTLFFNLLKYDETLKESRKFDKELQSETVEEIQEYQILVLMIKKAEYALKNKYKDLNDYIKIKIIRDYQKW